LSATWPVADVVRDIKANSWRWMNEQTENKRPFEWQKRAGAFTVSYSQIEKVRVYIQKQGEQGRQPADRQQKLATISSLE